MCGCSSAALDLLGFQGTGSLLIARTADEAAALRTRQQMLESQGLTAELLGPEAAALRCPALAWGPDSLALELPSDEQVRALCVLHMVSVEAHGVIVAIVMHYLCSEATPVT